MNVAQKNGKGRPRKAQADRNADRQALIDAAFAILRDGGSAALTARGVAERAGTAVGSVYTAFDSLEALRLEANAITMEMLRTHLVQALETHPADGVEPRLLRLADAYIAFADAHRTIWAALFEPRTLPAPTAITDSIASLFAVLEKILRETASIEAQEASLLARSLWSSVHGTLFLAEIGNLGPIGRDQAPALVHALVRTVAKGLDRKEN